MNDNEDLDLQALQRQLDDAFETTRPRAAFEDELWSTMQARRPWWRRVREVFGALVDSVREAPRVPATAVAVVLVLAIGVGILSFSGFRLGGGGGSATSAGSHYDQAGGAANPNAVASGAFGQPPAPALQPVPVGDTGAPKANTADRAAAAVLYLGPANLVWAGQLNVQVTSAPVYRYQEPTSLDADRFATALGASPTTRAAGSLGNYSGNGFALGVAGSSSQPPLGPVFYLTPDRSKQPAQAATPTDTATAYLTAHSLMPTWPYVIAVDEYADFVRVNFLRQFAIPAYGFAYLVNASGGRYGLAVDMPGGQPGQVVGPLPITLETADYPLISADQAVRLALASKPSSAASIAPTPTVRLTKVELVYALAVAGDHGFYEPAYLFSGTFVHNGVTYVKRVLVPAVGP